MHNEFVNTRSGSVEIDTEDRRIGKLLGETRNLNADHVTRILEHQRQTGQRFGDAAIDLGFVSQDDVMFALAQQFHYPYAPEQRRAAHPELVMLNQPYSAQAEAFRAVRSQLMMRVIGDLHVERRAVAVLSPDAGDGKSYACANLAVALAQLGGRTLLVDADLRGPRQHEIFGIQNSAGLSAILAGRVSTQAIQRIEGTPGLFVLPVGATPPNPLELIERPAFAMLMRELLAKFDHVIVDTPASVYGTDGLVIAARCGAALLIARRNRVRAAAMQELAAGLRDSPATVVGVVMNEF